MFPLSYNMITLLFENFKILSYLYFLCHHPLNPPLLNATLLIIKENYSSIMIDNRKIYGISITKKLIQPDIIQKISNQVKQFKANKQFKQRLQLV